MTKGKIILGVVAALVTTGSTLAFKIAKKFSNKVLHVRYSANTCYTCNSLRTAHGTTGSHTTCLTAINQTKHLAGAGTNTNTFYTVKTSGGKCAGPYNKTGFTE